MGVLSFDDEFVAFAEGFAVEGEDTPAQTGKLFSDMHDGSLSDESLTLIGHSSEGFFTKDPTTIGNKTPKAIAEALAKKYGANKEKLQDLYLLSCEAGLWYNGEPPLADQLAKKLAGLGFHNVKVHAFTSPTDHKAGGGEIVTLATNTERGTGKTLHTVSAQTFDSPEDYVIQEEVEALEKRKRDGEPELVVENELKRNHRVKYKEKVTLRRAQKKRDVHQMGETIVSGLRPDNYRRRMNMPANTFKKGTITPRTTQAERDDLETIQTIQAIMQTLRETILATIKTLRAHQTKPGKKERVLIKLELQLRKLNPVNYDDETTPLKTCISDLIGEAQGEIKGIGFRMSDDKRDILSMLIDCQEITSSMPNLETHSVSTDSLPKGGPHSRDGDSVHTAGIHSGVLPRTQKATEERIEFARKFQACKEMFAPLKVFFETEKTSYSFNGIYIKAKTQIESMEKHEDQITSENLDQLKRNISAANRFLTRHKSSPEKALITELNTYIGKREGEYIRNAVKSFLKFITCGIFTNPSHNVVIKIIAATNLVKKLEGSGSVPYSDDQKEALGEGRLSRIINHPKYEKIPQVIEVTNETTPLFKEGGARKK